MLLPKIGKLLLLCCSILWFGAAGVSAHQPRLVTGEQAVDIERPEISQAFYATLAGEPDLYRIEAPQEFKLYLGLLLPDLRETGTDIAAAVYRVAADGSAELIYTLDGEKHRWETFFEPFAGDRYYRGPEFEETMPAGLYRIRVSNRENEGKYVLAVGREEKFSAAEALEMISVLPALKLFFEKSPLTAYFNLVGLFMVLLLLVAAALAAGLYRLSRLMKHRLS